MDDQVLWASRLEDALDRLTDAVRGAVVAMEGIKGLLEEQEKREGNAMWVAYLRAGAPYGRNLKGYEMWMKKERGFLADDLVEEGHDGT